VDALGSALWRTVLADQIRQMNQPCDAVRSMADMGYQNNGRVARVVCEVGQANERVLRVVFYTDGDISVKPWDPR
jgi:hypothetical protein